MAWDVEYTDEFGAWWSGKLDGRERESVAAHVALLEERGPALDHPYSSAILLVGGTKKGDDRWYEVNIPIAEKLYANHLRQLVEEGLIDGKEVS